MRHSSGSNTGPLENMKQILMSDPNVVGRTEALQHFLTEYQNDKGFLPALKEIALRSPYPDVVWELFKFMGKQSDHGVPFFVQIITDAETSNNISLADGAFQFLGNTFNMYPDVSQKLQPVDLTSSGLYHPCLSKRQTRFF